MTLFVSIFSILMVILANHPANSGTVRKSNRRGKQDLEFEFKPCDYVDLVEVGKWFCFHCSEKGGEQTKLRLQLFGGKQICFQGFLFVRNLDFHIENTMKLFSLFQSEKGLRRQFLMTQATNIIVLLKRGEKVTNCNFVMQFWKICWCKSFDKYHV